MIAEHVESPMSAINITINHYPFWPWGNSLWIRLSNFSDALHKGLDGGLCCLPWNITANCLLQRLWGYGDGDVNSKPISEKNHHIWLQSDRMHIISPTNRGPSSPNGIEGWVFDRVKTDTYSQEYKSPPLIEKTRVQRLKTMPHCWQEKV